MRVASVAAILSLLMVAWPSAQRSRSGSRAGMKLVTTVACVSNLGEGVKSHRAFCDVLVGTKPTDSVQMEIPAHTGTATLMFDLHNRFTVPVLNVTGAASYARHDALVAVVRPQGEVIGRAAAVHEYRSPADFFDQIAGGARAGGVKAVAPGMAEAVKVTIPAGVPAIGIVGVRLKVWSRAGEQTFDTVATPIAIVSNLRIEYRPR